MNTSRCIGFLLAALMPVSIFGTQLSLGSANLTPSATANIDASYISEGSQVSGLQFDLFYDSTVMTVTASLGSGLGSVSKTIYTAGVSPNQVRVAILGVNQDAVPDGPVISLTVTVLPTAANGSYPISIIAGAASGPNGDSIGFTSTPATVTVTGGAPPSGTGAGGGSGGGAPVTLSWILNAASLRAGPVAPGELVALFGTNIGPPQPMVGTPIGNILPSDLGGVSIIFDGAVAPAPLLYADSGQINTVVPYELAGRSTSLLLLKQNGVTVARVLLTLTPVSPAIFTLEENGVGPVIAYNQDGSLNSGLNPAPAGSIVTMFLTGCGQTNPAGVTGQVLQSTDTGQLVSPVTATVQGLPASLGYTGPAPGSASGVSVIQVVVPSGVTSDPQADISLTIAGVSTSNGVSLAVSSN